MCCTLRSGFEGGDDDILDLLDAHRRRIGGETVAASIAELRPHRLQVRRCADMMAERLRSHVRPSCTSGGGHRPEIERVQGFTNNIGTPPDRGHVVGVGCCRVCGWLLLTVFAVCSCGKVLSMSGWG